MSTKSETNACKEADFFLDESKTASLLKSAVEASYDAVLITEANLDHPVIVYVNPAFCRMTGYDRVEAVGKTPAFLQGENTDRRVTGRLRKALEAGRSFEARTINYRKSGEPFHLEWRTSPVLDADGRVTHYVAVQRDVSGEVNQILRLKRLAEIDGLTRLFTRKAGESALESEADRSQRKGEPMSVIMIDIDHFKQINDEHGHAIGDQVLARVASLIDQRIRGQDLAIRWGGEEFVVVLRETSLGGAARVAEALRVLISSTPFPDDIEVTISAGVAERLSGELKEQLMERADRAMYESKSIGRDRVTIASSGE